LHKTVRPHQGHPRLPIHFTRVHQGQIRGSRHIRAALPRIAKATDSLLAGTPRTHSEDPDTSTRLCHGQPGLPLHLSRVHHGPFRGPRHHCTALPRTTKAYRFTTRGYTKDKLRGSRHTCTASPRTIKATASLFMSDDVTSSTTRTKLASWPDDTINKRHKSFNHVAHTSEYFRHGQSPA
jgi:hypothetical protein